MSHFFGRYRSNSSDAGLDVKVKTEVVTHDDENELAKQLESLNAQLSDSLLQQEEQKRAHFLREEEKHQEVAGQVTDMYTSMRERYKALQRTERDLSGQAGQLLNALQREEARAAKLSSTVRKIRHTRKKLLARIITPRWEVCHHYHMTCVEHGLGHTQPHVLEVGSMVPGHLRLFSYARLTILSQKTMIFSLNRSKTARESFSDKIKDVYRSLRLTRADIKDQEKLLNAMQQKSHLLPSTIAPHDLRQSYIHSMSDQRTRPGDFRMRYFNSLNMSPDQRGKTKETGDLGRVGGADRGGGEVGRGGGIEKDLKQEMNESGHHKGEWNKLARLLQHLEQTTHMKAEAEQDLVLVESCRKRFEVGVSSLPAPMSFSQEEDNIMDQNLDQAIEDVTDRLETLSAPGPVSILTHSTSEDSDVNSSNSGGGLILGGDPYASDYSDAEESLAKDIDLLEKLEQQQEQVAHAQAQQNSSVLPGQLGMFNRRKADTQHAEHGQLRRKKRSQSDIDKIEASYNKARPVKLKSPTPKIDKKQEWAPKPVKSRPPSSRARSLPAALESEHVRSAAEARERVEARKKVLLTESDDKLNRYLHDLDEQTTQRPESQGAEEEENT